MEKFFDTAHRMMARRGRSLSEVDNRIFLAIRELAGLPKASPNRFRASDLLTSCGLTPEAIYEKL